MDFEIETFRVPASVLINAEFRGGSDGLGAFIQFRDLSTGDRWHFLRCNLFLKYLFGLRDCAWNVLLEVQGREVPGLRIKDVKSWIETLQRDNDDVHVEVEVKAAVTMLRANGSRHRSARQDKHFSLSGFMGMAFEEGSVEHNLQVAIRYNVDCVNALRPGMLRDADPYSTPYKAPPLSFPTPAEERGLPMDIDSESTFSDKEPDPNWATSLPFPLISFGTRSLLTDCASTNERGRLAGLSLAFPLIRFNFQPVKHGHEDRHILGVRGGSDERQIPRGGGSDEPDRFVEVRNIPTLQRRRTISDQLFGNYNGVWTVLLQVHGRKVPGMRVKDVKSWIAILQAHSAAQNVEDLIEVQTTEIPPRPGDGKAVYPSLSAFLGRSFGVRTVEREIQLAIRANVDSLNADRPWLRDAEICATPYKAPSIIFPHPADGPLPIPYELQGRTSDRRSSVGSAPRLSRMNSTEY
ncbi:hypothetical protein BV898_18083 [Hypsibius exemplaris]|uniref:Uncharacterized protein n=1 Tax=Hypsibius exemplaris TaxID=2072580 RepID=A0A9X6RN58_HYPEX|nr:hypothetical protein BV898_18083 [Hypsibius exemplaris]